MIEISVNSYHCTSLYHKFLLLYSDTVLILFLYIQNKHPRDILTFWSWGENEVNVTSNLITV